MLLNLPGQSSIHLSRRQLLLQVTPTYDTRVKKGLSYTSVRLLVREELIDANAVPQREDYVVNPSHNINIHITLCSTSADSATPMRTHVLRRMCLHQDTHGFAATCRLGQRHGHRPLISRQAVELGLGAQVSVKKDGGGSD